MSKYGFLDVLEEEMDKVFPFDFEINWDKKNHAVEVAFLLEAQNTGGVALVDEAGEESELALDELMDFLADEEAESFEIVWNQEVFEEGKVGLEESTFYPYPRY